MTEPVNLDSLKAVRHTANHREDWRVDKTAVVDGGACVFGGGTKYSFAQFDHSADADLAVAAVNALPDVVAELAMLRAENEALRVAVIDACDSYAERIYPARQRLWALRAIANQKREPFSFERVEQKLATLPTAEQLTADASVQKLREALREIWTWALNEAPGSRPTFEPAVAVRLAMICEEALASPSKAGQ